MSDSVMFWLIAALLLFWAIGAYNRLVRLRSIGLAAFTSLDARFDQCIALVRTHLPCDASVALADAASRPDEALAAAWAALGAATDQFHASLKVARVKPLNAPTANALKTAYETLCSCWARLHDLPHDLAGATPPDGMHSQWQQLALQTALARDDFNAAVANYNQAISQFPALLLAALFVLRPAQPI